jgi:hypothetical protein
MKRLHADDRTLWTASKAAEAITRGNLEEHVGHFPFFLGECIYFTPTRDAYLCSQDWNLALHLPEEATNTHDAGNEIKLDKNGLARITKLARGTVEEAQHTGVLKLSYEQLGKHIHTDRFDEKPLTRILFDAWAYALGQRLKEHGHYHARIELPSLDTIIGHPDAICRPLTLTMPNETSYKYKPYPLLSTERSLNDINCCVGSVEYRPGETSHKQALEQLTSTRPQHRSLARYPTTWHPRPCARPP